MAKQHSIFISYRQVDGGNLATWIYQKLLGNSVAIKNERVSLSPQLDKAIPGGQDWQKYLTNKLGNAGSLLIVCSPTTKEKYPDRDDYFYHEIEWWIKHKSHTTPILVATEEDGYQSVPQLIRESWKNIQVSKIDSLALTDQANGNSVRNADIFLDSILRGISISIHLPRTNSICKNIFPADFNIDGFFIWEKDRFGRYIYANELYARAAGYDSPSAMLGKTDFQMPWRLLAKKFLEGDRKIMYQDEFLRLNGVFEKEIMAEKNADIFVKEGVLKDDSLRVIGVTGCFLDVTSGLADLLKNKYQVDEFGVTLGQDFGYQHLGSLEIEVLKGILKGMPKEAIAITLNKNINAIRSVIRSLKLKFQCKTENQLLIAAIRAGVPLQLYG